MSFTGLDVFDRAVQKSNIWLNELMDQLGWDDRHKAYLALRTTLHALRDRLLPEEAVQLGAQLPLLIRGFYYDGWKPSDKPLRERHRDQFLSHIQDQFSRDETIDAEQVARAVFNFLVHKISEGEIKDIKAVLPKEFQDFWP